MCVCDIIRREVRVVGVVSEHQALLLITTTSTCVVPQSVGPCLWCCCCAVSTRGSSFTPHHTSCCPAQFPSNQLSLSPPLSESGRHPLSRCGGVQTIGLTWMSMLIERIQGRETLQRTSATTPLCVCVVGVWYTRRCPHHHHTPLDTTRGFHHKRHS